MADRLLDSYLIALGYKVDSGSEARFARSVAAMAVKVAELGAAVGAAALAVVAGVAKISSQMEGLYYASQRIGSTVENIQALTFAIGQAGGTAAGARGALEGLGNFLRSNPGAEGFIKRLGVQTRDTHGGLRDTSDLLHDLGQRLKAMPYARARLVAQVMGVDENTLQALFRGTDAASAAIHRMYAAAHLDAGQAAKGAAGFMNQLRLFGAAIGILEQGVAAKLQGGVGHDIDRLRERLVSNFGRISDVIAWVARIILRLADGMVTLFLRAETLAEKVYVWWEKLNSTTRKWVVGIGLADIALRLLSKGFLATPLGRIVAIGAALLALYDDYQTWKAGGKSLIDWKQWSGDIDGAIAAFDKLEAAWEKVWPKLRSVAAPFLTWFGHEFASSVKDTLLDLGDVADAIRMAMSGDWKGAKDKFTQIGLREVNSFRPDTPASGQGLAPGEGSANEKIAQSFFKGLGLTDQQAAAFTGSAIGESGLNPNAKGDIVNGVATAGGIFQWHKDRRDAIMAATGIDVWHSTLQQQLAGSAWELSHRYQGAFFKVASDPTAAQGVADVTNSYLMPKDRTGAIMARSAMASGVLGRQGVGSQVVNNSTNVTVHSANDPHAVASAVGRAADRSNNRLARQMRGPIIG